MMLIRVLLSAVAGLLLCAPVTIAGTVIHVPADQPTIQMGVDAALDGDVVVVADGQYSEAVTPGIGGGHRATLIVRAQL